MMHQVNEKNLLPLRTATGVIYGYRFRIVALFALKPADVALKNALLINRLILLLPPPGKK